MDVTSCPSLGPAGVSCSLNNGYVDIEKQKQSKNDMTVVIWLKILWLVSKDVAIYSMHKLAQYLFVCHEHALCKVNEHCRNVRKLCKNWLLNCIYV